MPSFTRSIPDFSILSVNGKNTGATPFDTVPNDFVITGVLIRPRTVTSLISLPTLSIGTNPTNYDNKIPATVLPTALNATNLVLPLLALTLATDLFIAAGSTPNISITNAAVASVYLFDIHLIGYYL